jgi:hypothetical protein
MDRDDRYREGDPMGDPRFSRLAQAEFARAERFRAYKAEEAFRKELGLQRPSLLRRVIERLRRR